MLLEWKNGMTLNSNKWSRLVQISTNGWIMISQSLGVTLNIFLWKRANYDLITSRAQVLKAKKTEIIHQKTVFFEVRWWHKGWKWPPFLKGSHFGFLDSPKLSNYKKMHWINAKMIYNWKKKSKKLHSKKHVCENTFAIEMLVSCAAVLSIVGRSVAWRH